MANLRALPLDIVAVIPGAETGVELADSISARMGLRSNGEAKSLARRNKYFMGEAVRSAGVRAVKQSPCKSHAEVSAFLKTLTAVPLKCVVKPVQSAGTDDVFLCASEQEAITAFDRIYNKRNGLGLINESVLVQEYLVGKEYVIDKVSRDGVHKLVAIWEYDKRFVNNANFVYFGMKLMSPDSEKMQSMVRYADLVLDALDIRQGPSHMEVMYCSDGPCLVEVGSRCQGGEGTWLPVAKECVGYTQVEVALSIYTTGLLFDAINKDSYPVKAFGRELDMVNRQGGIVRSLPGESVIRGLPSFRSISWEVKPGDYAHVTIDCFTRPGCVQLVHENEEQADADFEKVHSLETLGLIDYAVICPSPPVLGAVVIVDPFSSGANLAAMVVGMGYRLVLVFSEMDSPVAKLVAKGTTLTPTLMVQHNNTDPDQDRAIAQTLAALKSFSAPVLAILPGAETGVELADRLAHRFGTRNNGEEWTHARRNKYAMQECVRNAGLRAVKQKLCRSETEIRDFLSNLPKPIKCVVKPNESAGTDSVFLCDTEEDAIKAFLSIHNHSNGLGQINDGALCQEFLAGTEYVVDGCSRDGVYKVTAIWKYDKRSVNGANFVYYGMQVTDGSGSREQELISYARQVVKALHIMHGPSHMEVMYCSDGPCLVEVGSRCHGGEATWLPVAKECVGYTQLDATLSCYLRPDAFEALPDTPRLVKHGAEAFLVSLNQKPGGILKDIPGLETIRNMSSFRRLEMLTQPGATLPPTIDCFTRPGSVQMVNESEARLQDDYSQIRKLEVSGLFEVV